MMQFKLVGLDSLQRGFREQPDRVRSGLQDIVSATSFSIAQRAKADVRVDSGAYEEAITAVQSKSLSGGVYIRSGVIRGRRPEVYWRFNEFGTVKLPARPSLRNAAQSELTVVENRVQHLASNIERDLTSGVGL